MRMSPPEICRICLCTGVKLYKYDSFELKKYYEQIMESKINTRDELPPFFCYQCAALLHKFHKFKEKCINGENVLKEILLTKPITIKAVRRLDKKAKNLHSTLNLINVTHRVKTIVVKSKENPEVVKNEEKKKEKKEIDVETSMSDNDNYDDDYKEEMPPLPEVVDVDNKAIDYEEVPIKFDEEKIINTDIKDKLSEEIENENEKIDFEEKIKVALVNIPDTNIDEEVSSDDDNIFIKDLKVMKEEKPKKIPEKVVKKVVKKNLPKNDNKKKPAKSKEPKAKRFQTTRKKKAELNLKNWLKFNLTEEEAIEEFQARAKHSRYLSAAYKCEDCLKGFSKEDMLTRHIKLRHLESLGPMECRFCHMRFKWKCYLSKHMRQHFTKFKCLRCDLVCPLENTALFHEEYHNGVIRKCAHCGDEFKHVTTYYTHLRTHRSKYVCTLCGASFVSPMGLSIHKKVKHLPSEKETKDSTTGEDEYCARCDIRFETKTAYEEHLVHSAMHNGLGDVTESSDGINDGPKTRRLNKKRLPRIPTDCHICGKNFLTQAACRRHHLAEHPRTSFYAPNERLICEICGVSLAPGSVSSHLNTHTRQKLYNCDTCGRQFNSKGGLNTHQLTHTSVKPVPCTLCDKRFKQSSSMKLHYRTFHLKEPYPKRNRKKKSDDKLDDYPHEDSDDNMTLDRWR